MRLGHTVTVFGATGFLGRYIVNRLGKEALLGSYTRAVWTNCLFKNSPARMHGHCAFPGGDGQATFEGLGRLRTGYIHGTEWQQTIQRHS